VLPARSGNVNVNPLRIVAKAGADGSRADCESCSQESTTAGGSPQLSRSRLVRCPCHGLHLLCVAKSTQRYARVRRPACSQLCVNARHTATPFQPYPSAMPVRRAGWHTQPQEACPNTPCLLQNARRVSCGRLLAFRRWRLRGNEAAAGQRPVPHAGVVWTRVHRLDLA